VHRNRPELFDQEIPWSAEAKYMGMHLERSLTWKVHITATEIKAMQRFVEFHSIFKCRTLNRKSKTHLYKSVILAILLHGDLAWGYAATNNMKKLIFVQNKMIRSIYEGDRYTSDTSIHIAPNVRTLNDEIKEYPQSFINASGNTTTQS
jgi:hypothetical protein